VSTFLNGRACCSLLAGLALCACGTDATPAGSGGNAGTGGNAGSAGGSGGDAGATNPSDRSLQSAQWPMPNSAKLTLPNPATYDDARTPGVVHDRVTGLDWRQDPGIELYTRADALDLCEQLSFAGFDDWRVPEFIELVSLFDVVPNETDPLDPIYIDPIFRAEGRFWSAYPVNSGGLGRLLDFTAAGCGVSARCSIGVSANQDSALGGAFCVRNDAEPATSARFEAKADVVTDSRTGLTWQGVPANVQTVGYADAVSACDALGNGSRLPSINELLSILVPSLDTSAFLNWPVSAFAWSSSAIPAKSGSYWTAAIGGATQAADATSHNRVQCVR